MEGGARTSQEVVLEDGANNVASLGRLGFGGVPPRMPVGIVDVDEPRSLAFTEADQLSSTQALSDTQAFGAGIDSQDCVDLWWQLQQQPARGWGREAQQPTLAHASVQARPQGDARQARSSSALACR